MHSKSIHSVPKRANMTCTLENDSTHYPPSGLLHHFSMYLAYAVFSLYYIMQTPSERRFLSVFCSQMLSPPLPRTVLGTVILHILCLWALGSLASSVLLSSGEGPRLATSASVLAVVNQGCRYFSSGAFFTFDVGYLLRFVGAAITESAPLIPSGSFLHFFLWVFARSWGLLWAALALFQSGDYTDHHKQTLWVSPTRVPVLVASPF